MPVFESAPRASSLRWSRLVVALALAGCASPTVPTDAASVDLAPIDAVVPDVSVVDVVAHDVVGPLGLRPGVPLTLSFGPLTRPSVVNLQTAPSDIDYTVDLAARSYVVRLPARFDPSDTTRRYGLITYIDFDDVHAVPPSYEAALDAHDIIWVAGLGIGNLQNTPLRRGVALLGALRAMELFPVDPARVYAAGMDPVRL